MPSRSRAQRRLMEAVAHDPDVAARTGIPAATAREFAEADSKDKEWKRKEHAAQKAGMSVEIHSLLNKV